MIKTSSKQTGRLSLILSMALLTTSAVYAMAQTSREPVALQVAIGLETKSATTTQIAQAIKQQLSARGVSVPDREVQRAATNALNLLNRSKDPQKGVIYIHTRKFTVCASWGKDKNFCQSH